MTDLQEMFRLSAAEQGWSAASQIAVLIGFVDQEAESDGLVHERFQKYLDEHVDLENGLTEESAS